MPRSDGGQKNEAFILLGSFKSLFEKECPATAAAIAYFALFSLFPAVILIFALSGHFLEYLDLRDKAIQKIVELFPGARRLIRENLLDLEGGQINLGVVASCLVIFVWSANWVFTFIESALDRAWDVAKRRSFWRSRLLALAMTAISCSMLAASIVLTGTVAAAQSAAARIASLGLMPEVVLSMFWQFFLFLGGLTLNIAVFALIYKIVPNTRVRWREALPGALAAAVLWQSANYLFARLLPYFSYQKVYGGLGAAIAVLTWSYLSSLIMLYGAQISAHLHRYLESSEDLDLLERLPLPLVWPQRIINKKAGARIREP